MNKLFLTYFLNIIIICVVIFAYTNFIYKPAQSIIKTKIQNEFKNEMTLKSYLIENAVSRFIEGAKSISSRSMIRKKIIEYKQNKISFDQLKDYTKPKYIDGVKALDACIYATRYIDDKILVEYGDSSGAKLNCIFPKMLNKKLNTVVYAHDTLLNVCVISPINQGKEILGYDILYSKCSKVLHEILHDKQKFSIISSQQDSLLPIPVKQIKKNALAAKDDNIYYIVQSNYADIYYCFSKSEEILYEELHQFKRRHFIVIILLAISITLVLVIMQQRAKILLFKKSKYLEKLVADKTDELKNVIDELQRSNLALKESDEKFRAITNSAEDGIILINYNGEIIFWNDAAEKIFNYSKDEVLGKNLHNLIAPERFHHMHKKAFEHFIKTGEGNAINKTIEFEALKKGEDEFPVELSLASLKLEGRWHAVGIIRDISERKRDEKLLKENNKELSRLNATKDKFFSIIAHDLMTPFNSMLGFSDILVNKYDELDKGKQKQYIESIHISVNNTYILLENLLTWSRSQRNNISMNFSELSLHSIVEDTLKILQGRANEKDIQISNLVRNNVKVIADRDMIKTVLRNLISNAIKFTFENGKIVIRAKNATIKNKEYVEITVSDNGMGIKPELQKKIFDLSESISTKGTNEESGTGLGLVICKEFVEKNGGEIWVESEPGLGSQFKFTLPVS